MKQTLWPIESKPTIDHPIHTSSTLSHFLTHSQHTRGNLQRANKPTNPHVFEMWEETGEPRGDPCHRENMQLPHRQHLRSGLNKSLWCCVRAALLCHPLFCMLKHNSSTKLRKGANKFQFISQKITGTSLWSMLSVILFDALSNLPVIGTLELHTILQKQSNQICIKLQHDFLILVLN